jgi:hypothetical protein
VDPSGRLALLLALARYTGRRLTAGLSLSAADVLRHRTRRPARCRATGGTPATQTTGGTARSWSRRDTTSGAMP